MVLARKQSIERHDNRLGLSTGKSRKRNRLAKLSSVVHRPERQRLGQLQILVLIDVDVQRSIGRIDPASENQLRRTGRVDRSKIDLQIARLDQPLFVLFFKRNRINPIGVLHLGDPIPAPRILSRQWHLGRSVPPKTRLGNRPRADFFIRKPLALGRMINSQQRQMVKVRRLPKLLGDTQLVGTILRLQQGTIDLEIFPSAIRKHLALGYLQTQRCVPEQVGCQDPSATIPTIEKWTRTDQHLLLL